MSDSTVRLTVDGGGAWITATTASHLGGKSQSIVLSPDQYRELARQVFEQANLNRDTEIRELLARMEKSLFGEGRIDN